MKCPVCAVDLAMAERAGQGIDYCPKCRGVWLEAGKLDKIIERSAVAPAAPISAVPGPPRDAYPAPRRDSHDDSHHGEHGYDKHGYDKHGRKKSILDRLFD